MDTFEKVQNKLKERYIDDLKKAGYPAVGMSEIKEQTLIGLFEDQKIENPDVVAAKVFKEAEADVFKEEHELAPRRWRTHVAKGSKSF